MQETLGMRLKARRESLGKTMQQIAEDVGTNKSTIQRYETDQISLPKRAVVTAIAKSLGVAPEWLLCTTDDMFPQGTTLEKLAQASEEDLAFTYALYEETYALTEENKEKLREMARFFKLQQEK